MHLDKLLEHLNPYGPYQIISWLVLSIFTCVPPPWHQFAITFTGYRPSEYGCAHGPNVTFPGPPIDHQGVSVLSTIVRLPIEGQSCEYTEVLYSDYNASQVFSIRNATCKDNFWFSQDDPTTSTIVTQWDLVCSQDYLYEIISIAEGVGEVIGCIIFGWLADRFGRKVGFFGSAGVLFTSGLVCAFAPHPAVAIASRVFIGLALTGMNNIGFMMNAELFTPNARTFFSTGGEMMWSLAVVVMAGIGYAIRDSFWFMMAITLPIAILFPFWWFLIESLHWNISKGHIERARDGMRHIAKFNKVDLDEDLVRKILSDDVEHELEVVRSRRVSSVVGNRITSPVTLHPNSATFSKPPPPTPHPPLPHHHHHLMNYDAESNITPSVRSDQPVVNPVKTSLPSSAISFSSSSSSSSSKVSASSASVSTLEQSGGGVLDLFRTPRLRMITVFLTLLWLANTMCYYGLQLAAQYIEGVDFYLSFFILAVVEVPSIFATVPAMHYLGRRWAIIIFQLVGGLTTIAVSFIPAGNEALTMTVAAVGKFAVCSSFTALYVYAVELFPTTIRGTGFGVVSVIGRIGMIIAPLVNSLGYGESAADTPFWLRNFIYGVGIIATGFLTLPLPETNHQPLADTIDEMEHYAQYCAEYNDAKRLSAIKRTTSSPSSPPQHD